jgi:ABC-type nitrate/sulfonate/bicarbonate transport system permease component
MKIIGAMLALSLGILIAKMMGLKRAVNDSNR